MKYIKKKPIIIVAAIILIIGGYYWYNKSESGISAIQYKTVQVKQGSITSSVSASGNVEVDQLSNIDPSISGTVYNLSVSVGDKVKKGQLLFQIDNDDLGIEADRAYSSYLQSKASLETSKANKKEAKNNYNDASSSRESIMKKKYEAAKISLEVSERNVQTSWSSYQKALSDASERKVTAPIDGTVNEINIENGDSLNKSSSNSNNKTPIIIGDLSTMKAKVGINEVDITNVQIGQNVNITFDAIDGLTATGKVEKIDALGTLNSGVVSYNVVISFDSLDARIRPQMSISAEIITSSKQDVLMVSNSAIKTQNGENYVQVINKGVPKKQMVKVGIANDTDTEIISGLNKEDVVVIQAINSRNSNSNSSSDLNSSSSGSNRSNNNFRSGPPGMMGL